MGVEKKYHLCLEPKLGHGTCAIQLTPCACVVCDTILKKCKNGVIHTAKTHYKHVDDCIYWYVFGTYKKWNIIIFINKDAYIEYFYEVHRVVFDEISSNTTYIREYRKTCCHLYNRLKNNGILCY